MSRNDSKRKVLIISLLLLTVLSLPFVINYGYSSTGKDSNVSRNTSIDGEYYYEDAVSQSTVTIIDGSWIMETSFGRKGYRGETKYDSGTVRGNKLYYSMVEYGSVNGGVLSIGGRRYRKQ